MADHVLLFMLGHHYPVACCRVMSIISAQKVKRCLPQRCGLKCLIKRSSDSSKNCMYITLLIAWASPGSIGCETCDDSCFRFSEHGTSKGIIKVKNPLPIICLIVKHSVPSTSVANNIWIFTNRNKPFHLQLQALL